MKAKNLLVALIIALLGVLFFNVQTSLAPGGEEADTSTVSFFMIVEQGDHIPPDAFPFEGCGEEYAVEVEEEVEGEGGLEAALNAMFSINQTPYPGTTFRNSHYMSELEAKVDGQFVDLEGLAANDGHCDTPRYKAQVELTIDAYSNTTEYPEGRTIRLNGSDANWRCLGDESGTCE
jgi:hypothetical protein